MIRPIDLQTTILAAQNVPGALQRAEEGPRMAAQAVQAAFAAELVQRDESVAPAAQVVGNRVDAEAKRREGGARKRKPRTRFEQVVDDAAGSSDEQPHIVDFSA